MVSARRVVTFAAFAVLTLSCGDNDNDAPRDTCDPSLHRAAFTLCRQATDQTTCEAAGGSWARGGFFNDFHCFCPTGQSACPCSKVSECLGNCVGPPATIGDCPDVTIGTCEAVVPSFGCVCTLRSEGGFTGICSD